MKHEVRFYYDSEMVKCSLPVVPVEGDGIDFQDAVERKLDIKRRIGERVYVDSRKIEFIGENNEMVFHLTLSVH